jgi:hypothetical protein
MSEGLRQLFLDCALDPSLARRWREEPEAVLASYGVTEDERQALQGGGPQALALLAAFAPQPAPGREPDPDPDSPVTAFPTLSVGLEVQLASWSPGEAPRWSLHLVPGLPKAGFVIDLYPWWDGALRLNATLRPVDAPSEPLPADTWGLRTDPRLGEQLREALAGEARPEEAWARFFDALGAP